MAATSQLVLGVDGGGTKTAVCLARIDAAGAEQIIGRGDSGSSNIKAVGPEYALANLLEAVDQAWSVSGECRTTVDVAVLALSGAGRPEAQEFLRQWDKRYQISHHLMLVHDALPVLTAGTPEGVGVAVISGTGAVAFAQNSLQQSAVSGGWGFWFGDEGSAYWLGQAAARAVSQAHDGRTPATSLTQAMLEKLAIDEPREILTALARDGDVRSAMAGLARLVTDCAEHGDSVAVGIVQQAAEYLATLVKSAADRVGLGDSFPLAMAGGVLSGSPIVRRELEAHLIACKLIPSSIEVVAEPVLGCLRIAERELKKAATQN